MADDKNIKITKNSWWTGSSVQKNALRLNPYLIKKADKYFLTDPGSVYDIEELIQNISEIVRISDLDYIILHYPDPDIYSSIAAFEAKGFKGKIICHWQASIMSRYFNIKSDFYFIGKNNNSIKINDTNELIFIDVLHPQFHGTIMTFDPETSALYSGGLFGAVYCKWKLFADNNYKESMISYHENFMLLGDTISSVLDSIYSFNIKLIAPKHGSIITENIPEYIDILKRVKDGINLTKTGQNISSHQSLKNIVQSLVKYLVSLHSEKEIFEVFNNSRIHFSTEFKVTKYDEDNEETVLDYFLERILAKLGYPSLMLLEPMIKKTSSHQGITIPRIFTSSLFINESKSLLLHDKYEELKEKTENLQENLKDTQKKLSQDSITGLYKQNFFEQYLKSDIETYEYTKIPFSFFILDIDNIANINNTYGKERGDEVIQNIAFILKNYKRSNPETAHHLLFKMNGPRFVYYIPDSNIDYTIKIAEEIRLEIYDSELFINKVTTSIGVINNVELDYRLLSVDDKYYELLSSCMLRVSIAKEKGMNQVCFKSDEREILDKKSTLIIIEPDRVFVEILKLKLKPLDLNIITHFDGDAGFNEIKTTSPVAVISELFIEKSDGFTIRENMLRESSLKNIPFIIISHKKDIASLNRSLDLNITYYLQKPFYIEELISIFKNNILTKEELYV